MRKEKAAALEMQEVGAIQPELAKIDYTNYGNYQTIEPMKPKVILQPLQTEKKYTRPTFP